MSNALGRRAMHRMLLRQSVMAGYWVLVVSAVRPQVLAYRDGDVIVWRKLPPKPKAPPLIIHDEL